MATGHPVEKVIVMLQDLSKTAEAEGKAEALLYEKFDYWCRNSIKALTKAIEEETAKIETLEDKIAAGEAQEKKLKDEIKELEVVLADLEARGLKIDEDRKNGLATYEQTKSDLEATIEGIEQATKALTDSQAEKFLQVLQTPKVRSALALAEAASDGKQQHALAALLQNTQKKEDPDFKERPEFQAEGDLDEHVQKYDFKSGDVIETLKQLSLKFEDELVAANTAEKNAVNAYNLEKEALEDETNAAQASKEEKEGVLADVQAELVTWRADLESVKADKKADEKQLDATNKSCMVKKQEWEERSAVRDQEILAIGEAVKILSDVTGVSTKAPENPIPPPSPVALTQRSSGGAWGMLHGGLSFVQVEDPRQKALKLLRAAATKTHDKSMERLVAQFAAHMDDPFAEVNNMIEKMIFHLMAEQTSEDEHKAWCDQELSHNNASKVNKEEKIEELTMKIETADAYVVKLTMEIEEAQAKIAEMMAFMQEATEIREIGKKENAEAISDAQKAQAAIADATSVLEAHYKESGYLAKESWELLQKHAGRDPVDLPENPETWGKQYTGVSEDKPQGVLDLLKKVAEEFAKMEADTRAQEATDQAQFEEDIKANEIAKAGREEEVETKGTEKTRQLDIIASLSAARKHTSDELEKVEIYLEDLIPACVAGDSTYEDRKAARSSEIQALQEAQVILADAFKAGAPAPAPAAAASLLAPKKFLEVHHH
jgi:hypothetical protein